MTKNIEEKTTLYFRDDWLCYPEENKPLDTLFRGHLCIEYAITCILYKKLIHKKEINVDNFNFYKKIELLYILDIIDSISFDVLKKINQLRNNFAHNIDFVITIEDLKDIAEKMEMSIFEDMFEGNCIAYNDIITIDGLLAEEISAIYLTFLGIYDEIN